MCRFVFLRNWLVGGREYRSTVSDACAVVACTQSALFEPGRDVHQKWNENGRTECKMTRRAVAPESPLGLLFQLRIEVAEALSVECDGFFVLSKLEVVVALRLEVLAAFCE